MLYVAIVKALIAKSLYNAQLILEDWTGSLTTLATTYYRQFVKGLKGFFVFLRTALSSFTRFFKNLCKVLL